MSHSTTELLSAYETQQLLPLSVLQQESIVFFRTQISSIIQGHSSQLLIILGPCSIDDEHSALEYASRLKALQGQIPSAYLLCMRVYCEKPRSKLGWKGYIYPDPTEQNPIKTLLRTRDLMIKITEMGVPIATEFLDPLLTDYYQDLVSWGSIGARTALSPIHRQLASDCRFPVGIKNALYGQVEGSISGVYAASKPQDYFALNAQGRLCLKKSVGNADAHLVLRGGLLGPNNSETCIAQAAKMLQGLSLPSRLVVDCSHGNSTKERCKQSENFCDAMDLIQKGNPHICALMLESYLFEGRQDENALIKRYGVSLTDHCLSWEQTVQLLNCC